MSPARSFHPLSRGKRTPIILAVALALGFGLPLPARASTPAHRRPAHLPTVVLVHGAWADASSWSRVVWRLQEDHYRVVAPPNPLRGLKADTAELTSFLTTISGPIILVGHSYGGAVITDAGASNPHVRALVYVDAFAPDRGESLQQLIAAKPGSALAADPTTVFNLVPNPNSPAGDLDLYLKPDVFRKDFANDVSRDRAAALAAMQRPLALGAVTGSSTAPAWKHLPSWYLVGLDDKVIPPAEQFAMAHRAGSHIRAVHASHVSLITHPRAVEQLIEAADEATR